MFKYKVTCKKCCKEMTIVNVYFTAGTIIVVEVICVCCNSILEEQLDFLNVQANIRNSKNCLVYTGTDAVN